MKNQSIKIDQLTQRNQQNQQIENNNQPTKNQEIEENKIQHKPSLFNFYLQRIKSNIFKRKVILLILNLILTLVSLIFVILIIVWQTSSYDQSQIQINKIFNTENQIPTLIFVLIILLVSGIFSYFIFKGKVMLLHCYWITCLIFLIIYSIIGASAYSITKGSCQQPSNYLIQKLRMSSISANSLYCSDSCPCAQIQNNNTSLNLTYTQNITVYNKVQDCPTWKNSVQSSFFSVIQKSMKCSGWCKINQKSYYTFIDYNQTQIPPLSQRIPCFESIQDKLINQVEYIKILSIFICVILLLIIFYINYYIFMEKEDEQSEMKNMKKKIKKANRKMQDQLKSSQRILQ